MSAASAPAEPAWSRFDTGTLWRITAPRGAVGHLFGTIHIGEAPALALPAPLWGLLDGAERLVVEVLGDTLPAGVVDRLQRLPAGQSVARELDAREQATLARRLGHAGVPPAMPHRYKPWVLTQWLQSASQAAVQPLDDRLIERARRRGIAVAALESVVEQFRAFECIGAHDQMALLKETLAMDDDFFDALNREVMALYRRQRTAELLALIVARFPLGAAARVADAHSTDCVIHRRNRVLAERLQPWFARPGTFAAIGAAHLVGPGGVLNRLVEAGHRVEAVGAPAAP